MVRINVATVLDVLKLYTPSGDTESADVSRIRSLLATVPDPWPRSLPLHVTGSAVIVHPASERVLLRWHQRQQAWLQVGGHGDPGESDPLAVALREGAEETGLTDLTPWPDASLRHVVIVDVPANDKEPAHQHADLRFVLATDSPEQARPEKPGAPLRWLTMPEALALTGEDNLRETLRRLRL
jgi:8-oxo-dGTP pyrophosphatase MutT (NUDIX family)